MGEVVNLRNARKRMARAEKDRKAAGNRALHGRSKAEAAVVESMRDYFKARHDAHLREDRSPDKDE